MARLQRTRGFTLIELVIVVVVVAILASIAVPAYIQYVIRAERAEAVNAILDVMAQQERYRANNPAYAAPTLLTVARTANPEGLGLSGTSDEGRWEVAILAGTVSATEYTVRATKVAGRTDNTCSPLDIEVVMGQAETATGTPEECWRR